MFAGGFILFYFILVRKVKECEVVSWMIVGSVFFCCFVGLCLVLGKMNGGREITWRTKGLSSSFGFVLVHRIGMVCVCFAYVFFDA